MWHVIQEETERRLQLLKEENNLSYRRLIRWFEDHQLMPLYEVRAGDKFEHDIWFAPGGTTTNRFFEEPWTVVALQTGSIPVVAVWLGDEDETWAYFTTTAEQTQCIEERWKN